MNTINKEKALVVPEPYAVYMVKGLRTMLVSGNDYEEYLDKQILLAGRQIYGYITLKNKRVLSKEEFDASRPMHKLSETEYEDRGWDEDGAVMYAYDFEFIPFEDGPKDIERMRKSMGEIWEITQMLKPLIEEEILLPIAENQIDELEKELADAKRTIRILKDLSQDLIFKPKGPWGEGFEACEKYVREKHPDMKDPIGYCAAIYHSQTKKETAEGTTETPTGWVIQIHKSPEDAKFEVSTINDARAVVATVTTEYEDYVVESSFITEIKIAKDQCPCMDVKAFRDYEMLIVSPTGVTPDE